MAFFKLKHVKSETELEEEQLEEIAAEIKDEEIRAEEGKELAEPELLFGAEKINNGDETENSNVEEICQQIWEARNQVKEAKLEYQAVTDYLTDIQKIDSMAAEQRQAVDDAARNIITLTRERSKYQSSDLKLSDVQFRHIARFEKNMENELKRMQENEAYAKKVKSDMRKLSAQKETLKAEKEDILQSQQTLKKLALLALGLISIMALILLSLSYREIADVRVPFIGTCVLAMAAAFYIFYEARKNNYDYLMNGKKLNKAISLLNTVKIKYVNNQNALDYQYAKLMVSGYDELLKLWERYVAVQREAEKYKSNTGVLNFYNNQLVQELRKLHIKDCDIWIYQAAALIDNREMVEIRHRLNDRRQKLRERIDFNYEAEKSGLDRMKALKRKNPSLLDSLEEVMKKYDISLNE